MKSLRTFVCASLVLCQATSASLLAPQVHDAANRAREIASERNRAKALAFFDEIQTIDDWSLAGGLGPSDKVYVTMLGLVLFEPLLKWDTVAATDITPNPSSQIQKWLCVNPKAETPMLELLASESPVARRIALEKLKNGGGVSPEILSKLRNIALNDDYLVIDRRPLASGGGIDQNEHVFSAPLSIDAGALLGAIGSGIVKRDEESLAVDGLAWLGREFIDRVDDRRWIMEALNRLSPTTPAIIDAQRKAKAAH